MTIAEGLAIFGMLTFGAGLTLALLGAYQTTKRRYPRLVEAAPWVIAIGMLTFITGAYLTRQ